MSRSLLIAAATLATQVAAHGYIRTFTLDGVPREGFARWNPNPAPDAIGWSFTTPDEGPILDYTSPDFVCRQNGAPSQNYGTVSAGGNVKFDWTSDDLVINPDGWAAGHKGPIITYIAPCNGDCTTVDKNALRWTKIAEAGIISGTASTTGFWATDEMRANGGSSATIPASIAPGRYVIRNEIIAMHRAHIMEPEFYAQCGNIEVTGSGTDDLSQSGVVASQLYSHADTSIFGFSIYDQQATTFAIPGPPLYQSFAKKARAFRA